MKHILRRQPTPRPPAGDGRDLAAATARWDAAVAALETAQAGTDGRLLLDAAVGMVEAHADLCTVARKYGVNLPKMPERLRRLAGLS